MSNYILPIILFLIIMYGKIKKINIYDSFIAGTKEGIEISITIFPSILAIIFSSRIFISSGFLDFILNIIKPIINIPIQILPIILLKPISYNASLSLMIDIFSKYGPDSYLGLLASVIQGSMDTTFYIISLYLGFGIKKIRKTVLLCLIANIIAILLCFIVVKLTY